MDLKRSQGWRVRGLALAFSALLSVYGVAEAAPLRIASINLCADSLLLDLVPPSRIVSVSYLSQDPWLFWDARRAAQFPANRGTLEEMLVLSPDQVVTGAYFPQEKQRWLAKHGIRAHSVAMPTNLNEVRENIRSTAEALGEEEAGRALLQKMDQALGPRRIVTEPMSAAIYLNNGATFGKGSWMNALLEHFGFTNTAAVYGIGESGFMPLEAWVDTAPLLLITNRYKRETPVLDDLRANHKALQWIGHRARMHIPAGHTQCADQHLTFVAKLLADISDAHR